jgi:hypothetical protein
MPTHGNGQKDARAVKRKYYLREEARHKRLTVGGDFVLSGRSAALRLSVPQPVNCIMFKYFSITIMKSIAKFQRQPI